MISSLRLRRPVASPTPALRLAPYPIQVLAALCPMAADVTV